MKNKVFFSITKKILVLFAFSFLVCFKGFSQTKFYWDSAKTISARNSQFPRTVNHNGKSFVFWQEIDEQKKEIWISVRTYNTLGNFHDNLRFAGPFSYSASSDVPDIYSATISTTGTLVVAVLNQDVGIKIYSSKDNARTFMQTQESFKEAMIAPRVFYSENGKFRLFTSVVKENGFQLFYADSRDGLSWSNFKQFNPGSNYRNPFLPVSIVNGNVDMVVFQAQESSSVLNRYSYQLYLTTTRDGSSWSTPILLTGQNSLNINDEHNYATYQNQRPSIYKFKDKVYVTWERTESINSQIWICEITNQGLVNRTSLRLTTQGSASRPHLFEYNGNLFVQWFDNRDGNEKVYYAEKIGEDWEEVCLIDNRYKNMFSNPSVIKDDNGREHFCVFYQQTSSSNSIINALLPDFFVNQPKLSSSTYKIGSASKEKNVSYSISFPQDTSGVQGYSYTWTKEKEVLPEDVIQFTTKQRNINVVAEEEGLYKLIIKICDYAGNWSTPLVIDYLRDITPPSKPVLDEIQKDDYGFALANSFDLSWKANAEEDIAGYNYSLEYLSSIPNRLTQNKTHAITRTKEQVLDELEKIQEKVQKDLDSTKKLRANVLVSSNKSKEFYNQNNGVYKFTVCAIDNVGNVSEPSSMLVVLNKYTPQTKLKSVSQSFNDQAELQLEINGEGFTYEGTINQIYLDKDGKAPYDLILNSDKFRIKSDSKISNVQVGNLLEEGSYKIGLLHSDRGLYFTNNVLQLSENGTVKIQSEYKVQNKYKILEDKYILTIFVSIVVLSLLFIIGIVLLLFIITTIASKNKERRLTKKEIKALLLGEAMPEIKKIMKKQYSANKRHQKSLRGKLVGFTIILVIFVTLFLTLLNGIRMVQSQQTTMADALQKKVDVLLESLATGVKNFLPTQNDLELRELPAQKEALSEAGYVTIIGEKHSELESQDSTQDLHPLSYVWATNDPDIALKVANYGTNGIIAGQTKLTDEETLSIISTYKGLNEEISKKLTTISTQIASNSEQIQSLAARSDRESQELVNELSNQTADLRSLVNNNLLQIANEKTTSSPTFTYDILRSTQTEHIFCKPVLYRAGNANQFFHGIILVQISTQSLKEQLQDELFGIIRSAIFAALIALVFGSLGAWILASLIVNPIKKLEIQLKDIGALMGRGARERMKLRNRRMDIKSKDEIGRLGKVVDSMTEELGKAAEDEFLNNDGKAVQSCLIPLDKEKNGEKVPLVNYKEDKLEIFGFYKGDSAVSGDYFDYKKLDDSWYVFIKCDVSGHGVPAALLVSVVATKFRDFYYNGNWSFSKNGINLKEFISSLNNVICGIGAVGKFVTTNVSFYNRHTGELYISNAGDNKIHILDGQTKKLQEITLSSVTPTVGGISSEVIDSLGGFKIEKLVLKPQDVLYLYTDGIDEAERLVRDSSLNELQEVKEQSKYNPETKKDELTKQILAIKEQFGQQRIDQIIQAVTNKEHYILRKNENLITKTILDNPKEYKKYQEYSKKDASGKIELDFDFTTCNGTIEETIIALASIERVFRMIIIPDTMKNPDNQNGEIIVENFIDKFLKEHFSLYSKYCLSSSVNNQSLQEDKKKAKELTSDELVLQKKTEKEDANNKRYTGIQEDKQADDITLIAIKRV